MCNSQNLIGTRRKSMIDPGLQILPLYEIESEVESILYYQGIFYKMVRLDPDIITEQFKIMNKHSERNPYPDTIPHDVWTAYVAFRNEDNLLEKQRLQLEWKKCQCSYEMDDKRAYKKDRNGRFIKKETNLKTRDHAKVI